MDVRISVLGDDGSGKSSLIMTLLINTALTEDIVIPTKLPDILIPPGVLSSTTATSESSLSTTIVDCSGKKKVFLMSACRAEGRRRIRKGTEDGFGHCVDICCGPFGSS